MVYNKLPGVDTLEVQVGLQHLSFQIRGRPIMFLKQLPIMLQVWSIESQTNGGYFIN